MTPTERGLIKMVMALCNLLNIDPLDLAMAYNDTELCQGLYDKFLLTIERSDK